MRSQSNDYPIVTQYDSDHIAVPTNITPTTKDDPMHGEPINGFDYDLLIIPASSPQSQEAYINSVQTILDLKAQEMGYDNIFTACTYISSTNATFQKEGQACLEWRDLVWSKCYEILSQVQAGQISPPTINELLNFLPVFTIGV